VKWENGEKEREGEERRKAERSSLAGRLLRVCPARIWEEERGRCYKLRELYHTEVATMVTLAGYECSHHCAGVVTCFRLLWE